MLIVNSFNKKKFLKFTVITRIWNVVWRGVEGEDLEERRGIVEQIMRRSMGRVASMRGVVERRGRQEDEF